MGVSATRNSMAPGCLLFKSFKKLWYFSSEKLLLNWSRIGAIMSGEL